MWQNCIFVLKWGIKIFTCIFIKLSLNVKVRNKHSLYCILMFIYVKDLQFSFLFII